MNKLAAAAVLAVSFAALAEEPVVSKETPPAPAAAPVELDHRLDFGLSGGINNPGGIAGLEADFRILDYVSVGVAGGYGAWGPRVTPQVRVYPFGNTKVGLFVEVGSSLNFGGTTSGTDESQKAYKLFTPTVNLAAGWRIAVSRWAWVMPRVGWSFRLRQDNIASSDHEAVTGLAADVLSVQQPGGFVIGFAMGFAVL